MDVEEVKEEVKQEVPQSQPVNRTLTAEEAALKSILEEKDDSWLGLTDKDVNDFSLMEDPFKLPKEAQKLQDEKKFVFRWCEAKSERVLELKNGTPPRQWFPANRQNTPELAKLVNDINGGIRRLDQVLMARPYKWAMIEREMKNAADEARFKARDPQERDGMFDGNYKYSAGERAKLTERDKVVFDESVHTDSAEMSIET